jgi:hypothetical protein
MFDNSGSKKSLMVIIEHCEFKTEFHYFITAEFEGSNNVRRRTNVSSKLKHPVFAQNKFYLPMYEESFSQNQRLLINAFCMAVREEHLEEQELASKSKLLGTCSIDMTPLIAE